MTKLSAQFLTVAMMATGFSLAHANTDMLASAVTTPSTLQTSTEPAAYSASTASTEAKVMIPLQASTQTGKKAVDTNAASNETLDVTSIDSRLANIEAKAKHYPPRFADKAERRAAEAEIKALVQEIDQYAVHPNASFEVLIRAVKANQMSRNMDVGMESALKAGVYMRRAIKLQPNNAEANLWYGVMLTEGGGIKEGIPYLNKAAKAGKQEAYLSLAQAYLYMENRALALTSLESYRTVAKDDQPRAQSLIDEVKNGKTGIW